MRVRQHKGYGHGLRPGEDWDMNCPSCKRDKAEGIEPVITGSDDDWAGKGFTVRNEESAT